MIAALAAGDRIDRFELLSPIGMGSQASVWKARDRLDGQLKALKLVSLEHTGDDELERVRREARALAKLDHPSLVACHALVEDVSRGYLAAALDWVQAAPLSTSIDDGRLDERRRQWILRHLASAVAYLHDRDIVHRDIKMANVLIASDFWSAPLEPAHVKLVDFGIAVRAGNPKPLTRIGAVVGTLRYIPPEAVNEIGGAASTTARDVFALGVLGWYLLANRFPGPRVIATLDDLADVYERAADHVSIWPGSSPHHPWASPLARCLALAPERRPSIRALLDELGSTHTEVTAELEGPTRPHGRPRDGKTEPLDEPEHRKTLPATLDQTIPAGPSPSPSKPRFWLTQPRTSYRELSIRRQHAVVRLLILCIALIAATVAVLLLLR